MKNMSPSLHFNRGFKPWPPATGTNDVQGAFVLLGSGRAGKVLLLVEMGGAE